MKFYIDNRVQPQHNCNKKNGMFNKNRTVTKMLGTTVLMATRNVVANVETMTKIGPSIGSYTAKTP